MAEFLGLSCALLRLTPAGSRTALLPPSAVPHTQGTGASLPTERQPHPPGSGGRTTVAVSVRAHATHACRHTAGTLHLTVPSASSLSSLVLPSPTKVLGGPCHLSGTCRLFREPPLQTHGAQLSLLIPPPLFLLPKRCPDLFAAIISTPFLCPCAFMPF